MRLSGKVFFGSTAWAMFWALAGYFGLLIEAVGFFERGIGMAVFATAIIVALPGVGVAMGTLGWLTYRDAMREAGMKKWRAKR